MKIFSFTIATTVATVLDTSPLTCAFPTGAGGCAGGIAAVGGSHLQGGATTGSLSDGGVTVTFGDTVLGAGETFSTSAMEEVSLVVEATGDMPIKGVLVRLQSASLDLAGALSSDDPLLQDAVACTSLSDPSIVGMTHTSNVDKTSIPMTIALDTAATVSVDITVVMENSADGSIYYYDGFSFSAEDGGGDSVNGGDDTGGDDTGGYDTDPTDAPAPSTGAVSTDAPVSGTVPAPTTAPAPTESSANIVMAHFDWVFAAVVSTVVVMMS